MKSKEQVLEEHKNDGYKPYDFEYGGFGQMMPEKSCVFCQHCTDIWYDSQGIYMIACGIYENTEYGLKGKCKNYKEELGGNGK